MNRRCLIPLLLVLMTTPLLAAPPTVAVAPFTFWTMTQEGSISHDYTRTTGPWGVDITTHTEINIQPDVLKELDLPTLTDTFIRHLTRTGTFAVLERAKTEKLLEEIRRAKQDTLDPEALPRQGRLIGADYLALGTLVLAEAEVKHKPIPYTSSRYDQITSGTLKLDLRLVETATGTVVNAVLGETHLEQRDMTSVKTATQPSAAFLRELQETLARDLATRLVDEHAPFTVVHVQQDTITVNRGTNFDITPGQTYALYRRGQLLTDPQSGQPLGYVEEPLGTATITHVLPRLSRATSDAEVRPGDILRKLE